MKNHSIDNKADSEHQVMLCIRCKKARFPNPTEQCYKFGGLICTVDDQNVGKYDRCRFGYTEKSFQ